MGYKDKFEKLGKKYAAVMRERRLLSLALDKATVAWAAGIPADLRTAVELREVCVRSAQATIDRKKG